MSIACYVSRFQKARLPFLQAHWNHHKEFCFDGFVGMDLDCQDENSLELVRSLGLTPILATSNRFNHFLREMYNTIYAKYPNSWILTLDSDEYVFYDKSDKVFSAIQQCEKENAQWVSGWLCDRFGKGGELLPCPTESYDAMSETYPIPTTFTRDIMKACDRKVVFSKGGFSDMHSHPGVKASQILRLDHFKWTDTVKEYLTERIQKIGNASYAWQHKNALRAVSNGTKVNLEDCWLRTQTNLEGWFDYEDLYQMIAREAPQNSTLVEIGVWMGKSASFLIQNLELFNKHFELWLVDYFKNAPTHYAKYAVDKTMKIPEAKSRASYLHRTVANLQKYKQLEKANILQCNSARAAKLFENGQCYFVYIDADHSYEACKADINAWLPKVSSPGVIAGHDYNWSSVKKAVDEKFGTSVKTNHNHNAWFVRI